MGFLDDVFGIPSSTHDEPAADSIFDSIFGGGGGSIFSSGPSLFGESTSYDAPGAPFSRQEPILPAATQVQGYGGQMFGSVGEAEKSIMHDFGGQPVVDPDTGYTGTPRQIYDRYIREGRPTARLVERYRRW